MNAGSAVKLHGVTSQKTVFVQPVERQISRSVTSITEDLYVTVMYFHINHADEKCPEGHRNDVGYSKKLQNLTVSSEWESEQTMQL
jgi:hypothetical protein